MFCPKTMKRGPSLSARRKGSVSSSVTIPASCVVQACYSQSYCIGPKSYSRADYRRAIIPEIHGLMPDNLTDDSEPLPASIL
jgi:hypothetical protein